MEEAIDGVVVQVRTMRLEQYVALSDQLNTGGLVLPGDDGASVVGATDNGDGTLTFLMSDGSTTDPITIPPGPEGLV